MVNQNDKIITKLKSDLEAAQRRINRLVKIADRRRYSAKLQNTLYQISELSALDTPMSEFFAKLHDIIQELMYAENFYIALYNDDNKTWGMAYFKDSVDTNTIDKLQNIPIADIAGTLTGYVLRTGTALFANETKQGELRAAGEIGDIGADSCEWLGIPLVMSGKKLGVMTVQSYDPNRRYSKSDMALLQFVSRHISTAVMRRQDDEHIQQINKALETRVQVRTAELQAALNQLKQEFSQRQHSQQVQSACYEIALQSQAHENMPEFFQSVHAIINRLIDARDFYIALYDRTTELLSFPFLVDKFLTHLPTVHLPESEFIHSDLLTAKVLHSAKTRIFDAKEINKLRAPYQDARTLPTTWMGVPLLSNHKVIGAVVIQSHEAGMEFSSSDRELLEFVASHLSSAVQRRIDAEALSQAHNRLMESNEQLKKRIKDRTAELEILLTQRNSIAEKLTHDAHHDSLTNLPNRSLLLDRLNNAIGRFRRKKNLAFAVLFLDLDRFKVINDSLGHLYGDRLLIEVGKRLMDCVRPGDTVARLGGDEFCVLLDDINQAEEVERVARRILMAIATAFILDEHKIYTSTSIGITTNVHRYKDAESVIRDADAAMYRAKADGKNRYAFFNEQLLQNALERLQLETDLRQAVEEKSLLVYYQPVYSLKDGELVGFEALSRWRHPMRGMISPLTFISIAEETGIIGQLTDNIFEDVAGAIQEWHNVYGKIFPINVNISTKQISDTKLLQYILSILRHYMIPPSSIKVEITESLLMNNFDAAQTLLQSLCNEGISVLLDDFGTGYSSLNYLHQFPITSIKIDRSFVLQSTHAEKAKGLLAGISYMAKKMDLSLVAEGIETIEQLKLLRSLDIEYGQGYLFGAPMPKQDAENLIIKKYHPIFATLQPDEE